MIIEDLYNKKVLMILAHSDDEIICGWPISQTAEIDRSLVIICDGVSRKGPGRLAALTEMCNANNIQLAAAGCIKDEFYRTATRYEDEVLVDVVRRINGMITAAVVDVNPDFIFTHNPVGEYGNGDHRLLFELVSQHPLCHDLIFTDLCEVNNCHRSLEKIPDAVVRAYYDRSDFLGEVNLNRDWYKKSMEIYLKKYAWTWTREMPNADSCILFLIGD